MILFSVAQVDLNKYDPMFLIPYTLPGMSKELVEWFQEIPIEGELDLAMIHVQ